MMSTLSVHCPWEDETAREGNDHLILYAEAEKMKVPTLHTHDCLRDAPLKGLLFFLHRYKDELCVKHCDGNSSQITIYIIDVKNIIMLFISCIKSTYLMSFMNFFIF